MKLKNRLLKLIGAFVFLSPLIGYGASLEANKKSFESPLVAGLDLQYYPISYKNYYWTHDSIFKTQGVAARLGLEWIPFISSAGKFGLGGGLSLGLVANVALNDTVKASLVTLPIDASFSYHADFIKHQILVPFVRLGIEAILNTQTSKTGGERNGVRSYRGYVLTAGIKLCLNFFDPKTGNQLDANTGINDVYLTVEYLTNHPLNNTQETNLSHREFRFGLRFEI